MVYNEPEYLPIWCRYYGKEFGPENCYIIDHGSDDHSTRGLVGFNVVRIPRSPKDNVKRTRFISRFASNLLEWYDAVIHSDVDEIVVPEPKAYSSLQNFIEKTTTPVVNAYGFDIYQGAEENPFDPSRLVLQQRRWVRFSSSMCKVVVARRPLDWSPGFHSADAPITFDQLFLFHLRYFDLKIGVDRLNRTRAMAWSDEKSGAHQRVADEVFGQWIEQANELPKLQGIDLSPNAPPLKEYVASVLSSEKDFKQDIYNLDLHIFGSELIEIPDRFSAFF
jgi:hypothetical protein